MTPSVRALLSTLSERSIDYACAQGWITFPIFRMSLLCCNTTSLTEFLSFPPTWPVFTPASKLAGWLESYAQNLDLNVWTSSTVISARPSGVNVENGWDVVIRCAGGTIREFKNVQHLVLATGLGGGNWNYPQIPGMVGL